jgi:uncharacterized protein YdeI (YjbR/CyaY-like superfamily)
VKPLAFKTPRDLELWLKENHATETELWVRVYKKGSGTPSVDWNDMVVAGLCWGWIDGQRKALDEVSFVQRMTPRRARSSWSKRNCAHAERLIAEGRMQPAGLTHVEAARRDGRWESAYAGSSEMVIPDDFLAALKKSAAAKTMFATLNRQNLFAIYHRLHTAKRPETRTKRIAAMVAQLASGKPFH